MHIISPLPSLLNKYVHFTPFIVTQLSWAPISQAGVIDISLKKPQAVAISNKRKTNDAQAMVVSGRVGTRTEPFLTYISYVMDLLEEGTLSRNGQCSYAHSSQGT
jgi:hypothetical protein